MRRLALWLEQQKTDRLVLGAKLLGALLLLAFYLELREQASLAIARAEAARTQARSVAKIESGEKWQRRAETARANLELWREAVWQASTSGVAAARIQSALEGLAPPEQFDSRNARVNPEPITPQDGAHQVLQFDLNLRGHTAGTVHVLTRLAVHSPRLIVTDMDLNLDDARSTLQVSGFAPFRKTQSESSDAAS